MAADYQGSFDIETLRCAYEEQRLTVEAVVEGVIARIAARGEDHVWISLVAGDDLRARAHALTQLQRDGSARRYPLFGIPFAVKDNIDVAGMITTAACPDYAYPAERNATVVQKLLDAGAVLVGKTNLDQFATGLVGTRSPYGIPINPFNAEYIPGGSSSGSAVAVAAGLVSFALGTDTAGSGRVPAAFNNIVGLKPTRGTLSTRGVVPACRSLDCVSIFAYTCADALAVMAAAAGYDAADPYSRRAAASRRVLRAHTQRFRFGVPAAHQLDFFGDTGTAAAYHDAVQRLLALGGEAVTIDYTPFEEAAALLYAGPWVAERYLVVGELLKRAPELVHPDVRASIARAADYRATDVYAAQHRLAELHREAQTVFAGVDCLVLPTVGRPYRIAEVLADPLAINGRLGRYTNFMNLLDLCAVAVPTAILPAGVPWGVTLVGAPYSEGLLASLGERLHRASNLGMGATGRELPAPPPMEELPSDYMRLCVCGAHMSGLALNPQLLALGARLWTRTRTASCYRLFAMEQMQPPRPGMVRAEDGAAVEVEIWELPRARFGDFIAEVPPPLSIGTVELADGTGVPGFLCESYALSRAKDISHLGSWRTYLAVGG